MLHFVQDSIIVQDSITKVRLEKSLHFAGSQLVCQGLYMTWFSFLL